MSYFRIGVSPEGSYRNAGKAGIATEKTATASSVGLKASADARAAAKAKKSTLGGGYRVTASGFETNRFTPPSEPLERDSFLDDIAPKSDAAAISLFNRIYREDAVAGAATDLIATLPWSDYTLSGIQDPAIMKIYEEAMEKFNPEVVMPDISRDYLKIGRVIMSLVFNEDDQTWDNTIPIDPTFCDIIPIPIYGAEPKIDMRMSPEMEMFLKSKDPRDRMWLSKMPAKLRKQLLAGKAPLDNMTTMFLARRVSLTDWKGTSLYHRILPYYAIEKALMSSTLSAARRRTRSILHLTCGIEDKWDPTPEELSDIIEAFETTEEDPVGAVIATRSGIEAAEIRSGADFWKISEEADFLKSGKLSALGLSESFLSGEASYSTVDASMSVFVESLKSFRNTLTTKTFYDKYFDTLARAHGFEKRKEADLAHGVRTSSKTYVRANPTVEEAMGIQKRDLLIPSIHWTKNLSPESDANYMDILEKAQSKGVPVTLKQWASAAGIDISTLEQMLPEDAELRKRIKKFLPKPPPGEEGEGGDGGFGAFSSSNVDVTGTIALGSVLKDDPKNRSVFGVKHKEFATVVAMLTKDNRTQRILRDDTALSRWLNERYEGDEKKVQATRYLLTRCGFADCRIEVPFINNLALRLNEAAKANMSDRKTLKLIQTELVVLAAIYNFKSDKDIYSNTERARARNTSIETSTAGILKRVGSGNKLSRTSLYSGV